MDVGRSIVQQQSAKHYTHLKWEQLKEMSTISQINHLVKENSYIGNCFLIARQFPICVVLSYQVLFLGLY